MKPKALTSILLFLLSLIWITGCGSYSKSETQTGSPQIKATATFQPTETGMVSPNQPGVPSFEPTIAITPTEPEPTPITFAKIKSFTNANYIKKMIFDADGNLWTGGSGGAVKWDGAAGEYIKYTAEDGLAGNYVSAMALAPDGAVWFGTCYGGISRFDGQTWKTYTVLDGAPDCVTSLAVTSDGSVWVGSLKGLYRLNDGQWSVNNYKTIGVALDLVHCLAVGPDGSLWVGIYENGGLMRFDGTGWQDYSAGLPERTVNAIAFAPDGAVWVGGDRYLSAFQNGVWKAISIPGSDQLDAFIRGISSIGISPNNDIWVGISMSQEYYERNEGVYSHKSEFPGVYTRVNGNWSFITQADGLVDNEITAILAGSNGEVYFGSYQHGVSLFTSQGWRVLQTNDEIPDNNLHLLGVTSAGELWFTSYSGTLGRYDGHQWLVQDSVGSMELNNLHREFYQADGEILLITDQQIAERINGEWSVYPLLSLEGERLFQKIPEYSQGKRFLSVDLIDVYKGINPKIYLLAKSLNITEVSIALRVSDTDWWLMTDRGLFRYDEGRLTPYMVSNDLLDTSIKLALAPEGTVWAVSKHGLARFDGTAWHDYEFPGFVTESVGSIEVDQNKTVWVTTLSGMYSFNGENWRLYTIKDGLANNLCGGIAFDSDGGLWVSTISGLSRISP